MRLLSPLLRVLVLLALLVAVLATPAQAHLMVAQKGTLNLVGDGAYLVLSLPVSALDGVDDDADGRLSVTELRRHAGRIEQQVQAGVQLLAGGQPLPLQGLMFELSSADDTPGAPALQLVVMGRFALPVAFTNVAGADGADGALGAPAGPALFLRHRLYGQGTDEQVQDITITRKPQAQAARFTPAHDTQAVLPGVWPIVTGQVVSGIGHVLGGLDHLLFLLVVLAALARAPRGARHALLTLSAFTAGHAMTLVGAAAWGWSVPGAVVEPAIAATIVGVALFDGWQHRRAQPLAVGWSLALVFGCALIHGLGLAGGLGAGLGGEALFWSLAGFNLGVELAQIGVAAVAALALWGVARVAGRSGVGRTAQAASWLACIAGGWWFVQRVSELA